MLSKTHTSSTSFQTSQNGHVNNPLCTDVKLRDEHHLANNLISPSHIPSPPSLPRPSSSLSGVSGTNDRVNNPLGAKDLIIIIMILLLILIIVIAFKGTIRDC